MGKLILGLDIGTASVGWALFNGESRNGTDTLHPTELINMGVRIFPESIDLKKKTPLNQDRQLARSMRRRLLRKARRLRALRKLLVKAGLLPDNSDSFRTLLAQTDPYVLRVRGLREQLSPYELGRALFHLAHRRGYLSNRKDLSADASNGVVATAISELHQEMARAGAITIGEYLAGLDPRETRRRSRYLARSDVAREVYLLLQHQKRFHPVLTRSLRDRLYWTIRFQRPLKPQKNLVGQCSVFKSEKRAPRFSLVAQEFMLLQALANLRVISSTTSTQRFLTEDEYRTLEARLRQVRELTWSQVQRTLARHGHREGLRYNLETSMKSLPGLHTEYIARRALGSKWSNLTQTKKQELSNLIHYEVDETRLRQILSKEWGLAVDEIDRAVSLDRQLSKGYVSLSNRVMRKAIPLLQKNTPFSSAPLSVTEVLNLIRPVQEKGAEAGLLQLLPPLGPAVRNPTVQRSFAEMRKIVNAIIRQYGKPTEVRVELARDYKLSKADKEKLQKHQKENETANEEAEKFLQSFGIQQPSREDKRRYRLWVECNKECPYTGRAISEQQLFGSDRVFDIEHIIPYSRCGDNSYMNVTLCHLEENTRKGDKTPFEMYSLDSRLYEVILQRIRHNGFPLAKQNRFRQERVDLDGFVSRQLNDTRYVCRLTKQKLEEVFGRVAVVTGQTTAHLRNSWGLNFGAEIGKKDRSDHRHHAIDAAVIACTTPRIIHGLVKQSRFSNGRLSYKSDIPFERFREQINYRYLNLYVSHRPNRRLAGKLHEDTFYSLKVNSSQEAVTTCRKPIEGLKPERFKNIVSEKFREQMISTGAIDTYFGKRSVKVRGIKLKCSVATFRIGPSEFAVSSDTNFCILISETSSGKWKGELLNRFEAHKLCRQTGGGLLWSIVSGDGSPVMTLCNGDMILIMHDGQQELLRLQKMSQTQNGAILLVFRRHHDALKKDKDGNPIRKNPNTLKGLQPIKVEVGPLGDILYAYERPDSSGREIRIPYSDLKKAAHY